MLPQSFPERMLHLLGEAEFAEFLASYERPRSAGLRLNPRKPLPDGASLPFCEAQVPWEPNGYYVCEGSRPGLHPWHHDLRDLRHGLAEQRTDALLRAVRRKAHALQTVVPALGYEGHGIPERAVDIKNQAFHC